MAKIGIQLYTVRDELAGDYEGTVRRVAQMGYQGVEFPGGAMEHIAPERMKALLEELDIELCGLVFGFGEMETRFDEIVEYCRECGCKTILMPMTTHGMDRDRQGFLAYAQAMNGWGHALRAWGIELLHHIHGNEFERFGGASGWDVLWDALDKEAVGLEIDVYWVEHGGQDSLTFVNQYGPHSPLIHLKDYADRDAFHDTEVGAGLVPTRKLIREAIKHRARWLIVEQEQFDKPSMESAQISLDNIRRMLSGAGAATE